MTPVQSDPSHRVLVDGTVVANSPLCREHYRIDLRVDSFPETEPGEFIQLAGRGMDSDPADFDVARTHEWGDEISINDWPSIGDPDLCQRQAMLRRPFSLAGRVDDADGIVLSVIYRVVGAATDWLAQRRAGDSVNILGPMGNRFPKPANRVAIFIGGGVGIPPLLYLAARWSRIDPPVRLLAVCGATTRDLLPLTIRAGLPNDPIEPAEQIDEFARFGVESIIATDDGTYGFHGLVTDALEKYLDRAVADSIDPLNHRPVLYTCGPEPMMKRIAFIAAERGLQCFVAVERAMACGMGTCQSCVIRVRSEDGWRYALSCTEGPIFSSNELLW